jgi:hypothetical protein
LSRIACGCCFRLCGIANDSPDPVSHVRAASSAELIGYGLNRAAEIFNEATRCLWDLIEEAVKAEKKEIPISSREAKSPTRLSLTLGEGTDACSSDDGLEPFVIPIFRDYPRPRFAGFIYGKRLLAA